MDNDKKQKIIKGVLIGIGVLAVLAIVFSVAASRRTGSGNLFGWGDEITDPNATASPSASASASAAPLEPDASADPNAVTIQVDDLPATMTVGDSQSLEVVILPKSADQTWSVSSTDQNIVTVAKRDGKLYYKAAKAGSVTVSLNHSGKAAKTWGITVKNDSTSASATAKSSSSSTKSNATATATPAATPTATPAAQDTTTEVVKAERYANSVACDANVKSIDSALLIGKEEIEDQSKTGAAKDANGSWVFEDPNADNKATDTSKFATSGSSAKTSEATASPEASASAEPSASATAETKD